jgi:hypothetical protein
MLVQDRLFAGIPEPEWRNRHILLPQHLAPLDPTHTSKPRLGIVTIDGDHRVQVRGCQPHGPGLGIAKAAILGNKAVTIRSLRRGTKQDAIDRLPLEAKGIAIDENRLVRHLLRRHADDADLLSLQGGNYAISQFITLTDHSDNIWGSIH